MGATTWIRAFDLKRYQQEGIPALQALLKQHNLALEQHCHRLDRDCGVQHSLLSELSAIVPTQTGGCDSGSCALRQACPFHPNSQGQWDNRKHEAVMQACQAQVTAHCLENPQAVNLGKKLQLYTLAWWYGNEMGHEYTAAEQFFFAAQDRLPLLLGRLCKRAGIWGWADGGYGEGCLGWLSAEEALQLAEDLQAYDLSVHAALPANLEDDYLREVAVPSMRASLAELRDFAQACGRQQLGIFLERH